MLSWGGSSRGKPRTMFENLTEKLQRTFKNLRGQGKLTEEHLDAALAEIREALLEGDVNVWVADELLANIRQKSITYVFSAGWNIPRGRRWPTFVACSKAYASCSMPQSSCCRPTICMPIGKPSLENAHGTDIAGLPTVEM